MGARRGSALLGIRDVATRMGISVPTLRRWDKSGRLCAERDERTGERLYRRDAVEALAARGTPSVAPRAARRRGAEPATDLVGRAAELRRVVTSLREGARVVTILGPGGIGKTTLARNVLTELGGTGKAVFCDLSSATDDRALATLEATLALEPPAELDETARIELVARRLARGGPALIALDNAEHVLARCAALVRAIRSRAPRVAFLVTSRRKLGLRDEIVVPLGPLRVPKVEDGPARILASEAVTLLVRAAARAGALLDARTHAATLGRIARRVDAIPLALELAAARLVTYSPPELLRSLDAQLDLEAPRKPARHRTLRAAILWSYELLAPDARDLFERLSVFRGGFGASGARAVAGSRSLDAARLLHELRDQSLVHAVPCESEPRFDFFESVRDLAAERLAARPEAERDARERHAAFVAELAQAVLEAPATDAPVAALVRERDNVLAALVSVETTDPERALLLAVATDCAAGTAMPIGARVLLLDDALRRATPRVDRALVARALAVRGRLAIEANQTTRGVRDLERARVVAKRSGTRAIEEYVVGLLPVALLPVSIAAVRRALAGAEKLARGPSRPGRALTWAHVAVVHHELGDLAAAERSYARAFAVADAEGQTIVAARMRARLGRVYVDAGRLEDADDALAPALATLAGDRFEGWARAHVALLAWKRGHLDDAREGYARAVELFGVRGALAFEVCNRTMLASVLAALGRGVDALAEIERARIDAAPLKDAGLDAGLALAEAHRALLETRRGGSPARVDLSRARRRALRDKDVRALLERLEAMRTADLPTRPVLAVASDGAWFTPPDDHRAALPAGSPLRAIVRALAVASERTSTRDELVAAAWPAERILPRAAAHRLHAAMSELRALGLGRHLERLGDGYRLHPALAVRIEG